MTGVQVAERGRVTRALRNTPFATLWVGQSISIVGNAAFTTALAWQVLLLTGSATAMGLVVIAQSVPQTLLLAVGGVVADRVPRRTVMLWSDTIRGLAVVAIAALSATHTLHLWQLVALGLLFGVVRSFFDPAYLAIMPLVVTADELSSANALTSISQQVSRMVGPALGALFVAVGSPASAFAVDGLTFAVSAICLLLLPVQVVAVREGATSRAGQPGPDGHPHRLNSARRFVSDLIAGVRYVAGTTWLWIAIVVAAVGNMTLGGPLTVALPRLVHDTYGADVWLLGLITTANAVGALGGTLLAGHASRLRRPGILAFGAALLAGVCLMGFGLPVRGLGAIAVPLAASCGIGFTLAAANLIWMLLIQQRVPKEMLGRVSSLDLLGSFALVPVGFLLAGLLADRFGPAPVFVAGGLFSAVVAVLALCNRSIRRLD